jgi:hypothetical protein
MTESAKQELSDQTGRNEKYRNLQRSPFVLNCTNCNAPLSPQAANTGSLFACDACRDLLRLDVFPAFNRVLPVGRSAATLQVDRQAGCFYHPRKKAVVPCDACGRFLCALCDVSLHGRHVCPVCLEKGKTQQKIKRLETHRTCYDTIALLVAAGSILILWLTIFTAPLVIYLTVRHWNSPSSIIPRSKVRFILAFVIAGARIAGWILFFSKLVLST